MSKKSVQPSKDFLHLDIDGDKSHFTGHASVAQVVDGIGHLAVYVAEELKSKGQDVPPPMLLVLAGIAGMKEEIEGCKPKTKSKPKAKLQMQKITTC